MKETNQLLEFPMIQKIIANNCITQLAKEQAFLMSVKDFESLQDELRKVDVAMTIHRIMGSLPLTPVNDISQSLKKVKIDGVLTSEELYDVFYLLGNAASLIQYFTDYEGDYDCLRDLIEGVEDDRVLRAEIERCIMPDYSIADHASEELYRIRKQIARLNTRIRSVMESYLRKEKDNLTMDNLTMRNDRLVLAVKAGSKNDVRGIVHATSSSGGTFFIEPEQSVVMNNELNTLKADEQEEIHKILLGLSKRVKRDATMLKYDEEIMTELDFLFAKGRFGNDYLGTVPHVVHNGHLSLIKARHPLIDQKKVVANDIVLDKKMLLISGSNTGGKTVALKTAGLLSLMALSGLPVPADEAEVPYFDEIFVDIGDEQSIEQSLSTYSSHMKRIIEITRQATSRSLVIIDEIGSGTDPDEGSCLAQAIIDHLLYKHCTILASTHYGQLKNYAVNHRDISTASVGFDLETMTPTYHLKLDSVGSSYAFEIAQSLGLDRRIINKAKRYREDNMSMEEKLLDKIQKQSDELEQKQEELKKLTIEQKQIKNKYTQKLNSLNKREERIIEEAHEKANVILEEAKDMVNAVADELREKAEVKGHHVTEAKRLLDESKHVKKQTVKKQDHIFVKGDHVLIDHMNREADVIDVMKNHQLLVSLNGLSIKLKDNEVTFLHEQFKPKREKAQKINVVASKKGTYEINVIGMRYNEAMETVDKFLDDAIVTGYTSVRIIHGMGTGALRNGIRKMLDRNKNVKSYSDGGPNEGGLGATLVYFE